MEVKRTVILKLQPDQAQIRALDETMHSYQQALNYISDAAHQMDNCSHYVRIHDAVYYSVREKFDLPSQITISAERQVATAYAVMKRRNQDGQPIFKSDSVMLQGGKRGRDFRLVPEKDIISISTVRGRKKVPFVYGVYQQQYFDWLPASATLVRRKGEFYLHICFKMEVEQNPLENVESVIGVDVGMNYLATAIGPDGKTLFFAGGEVKQRKHHYRRVRRGLQRKGTKSAMRTLKHLAGKEARYQRDVNHVVSKRVVEFAASYPNPVIVLEDLTGIRDNAKHRKSQRAGFHSWAFAEIRDFITYKAAAAGIPVVTVDPRNTSKTCPRCGAFGTRHKHDFTCSCGFYDHADRVGAMNIAQRFVVHRQVHLASDGAQSIAPKVSNVDDKERLQSLPASELRDKPAALAAGG